MPPNSSLVAGLALAGLCVAPGGALASDSCQRATGGKCPIGKTAPAAKPQSGKVNRKPAPSNSGSRLKSRSQYSAAEREKIMERAREICRKEFGAPSRVFRIDDATSRVWCEPPSR